MPNLTFTQTPHTSNGHKLWHVGCDSMLVGKVYWSATRKAYVFGAVEAALGFEELTEVARFCRAETLNLGGR